MNQINQDSIFLMPANSLNWQKMKNIGVMDEIPLALRIQILLFLFLVKFAFSLLYPLEAETSKTCKTCSIYVER